MLKSISIRNLKGLSGDFEIGPFTVITGANRSGKSALLDAITLDMLGYVPSLGRQPASTKQLASGSVMRVSSTHDGYTLVQEWGKKNTITASRENHMFADTEMISLTEFFKLTSMARTRFLLKKSGSSISRQSVWAKIVEGMLGRAYSEEQILPVAYIGQKDIPLCDWLDFAAESSRQLSQIISAKINGAEAVVSEHTINASAGSLADSVVNVQPEIDALNKEQSSWQAKLSAVSVASAKARATAAATIQEGRASVARVATAKAQLDALRKDLSSTPTCGKCGGPVACPACAGKKSSSSIAIEAKELDIKTLQAQSDKLRDRFRSEDETAKSLEADRAAVEAEGAPYRSRFDELSVQQAKWHAAMGKRDSASKAESTIDELREEKRMLFDFKEISSVVIEEILSASMTETIRVANLLISPVLGITAEFQDDSFGYTHGKQFVSFKTLSGSEKAVFCAGIGMALTSQSEEKILLLDELGIMRDDLKAVFVKVALSLIEAGTINQCIVVDPSWKFPANPKVTVIEISNKA